MDKILLTKIEEMETIINILKWVIIFGTITFFISHLTIITQLPEIKRLLETICFETEEKEEEYKEKKFKEDKYFLIRCIVYAAIIGLFVFCLFL